MDSRSAWAKPRSSPTRRASSATSAGIEPHVPWDKVLDVIVTNEHLFLMFGRLVGLIVPRRAFANDGEAQRFAEFVRSKTQKPALTE